ncbi:MAG: hypothetical protein QF926_05455 [Alphaproteobacteria bacterium]|nr:hypothetical protein [Alphaproteobacteria bacterium]MDP6516058.1 hypothetical protein [Alphaproteobacteria bacterium]
MVSGSPQVAYSGAAQLYRAQSTAPSAATAEGPGFWGEDGFTFDDLVDLFNPLHHLPVIGTLYRELTEDRIAPGPRLIGAALFGGGPLGAALGITRAAIDIGVEDATGKDMGGHALAALGFESDPDPDSAGGVEVAGLPWLDEDGATGLEAATVPERAGADAVAISRLAPPPQASEPSPMEPGRPPATEARQAAVPTLDETQWAELLASLPGARDRAERKPTAPSSPDQNGYVTIPAETLRPFDISAAMTTALDKYTELTRRRRAAEGGIDRIF